MIRQIDIEDLLPTRQPSKRDPVKAILSPAPASAGIAACLECGHSFSPRTDAQEFCSADCRRAWNNRRATRGAELYDWWMSFRIERVGRHFKVLCRLAARWRAEDKAQRQGRRSWGRPEDRLKRDPSLLAEIHTIRRTPQS
jgi:hypothetical protein